MCNKTHAIQKIMSDLDDFSNSGEDDSEGSLVDFIVGDEELDEEEEGGGMDVETNDDGEEEDVEEITNQYNPTLETHGIVLNSQGLRRSTRVTKGKPPVKYVDDEYLQLMTDDIGSDLDKLSSDEDEEGGSDEDEDFELENEEEEEEEDLMV
jgi:hypothetical protein